MIFSPKGSDDERTGPQSEARPRPSVSVSTRAVRDARHRALRGLPSTQAGKRQRAGVEAADRRAVHAPAVSWLAADHGDAAVRGNRDQPQAGAAADAADGDRRPWAETADHQAVAG